MTFCGLAVLNLEGEIWLCSMYASGVLLGLLLMDKMNILQRCSMSYGHLIPIESCFMAFSTV